MLLIKGWQELEHLHNATLLKYLENGNDFSCFRFFPIVLMIRSEKPGYKRFLIFEACYLSLINHKISTAPLPHQ